MKGSAIFLLAALATASSPGPAVDDRPEPRLVERWFDGAAKETDSALEAWADEDYEKAQPRLERAYQITPEDPRARFNAGTGRIAVGDLETAADLLEDSPAGSLPEELQLAADAAFNLGTGFHQAGDLERAIAAYEAALRRDSNHGDAKFNLELALRQQEQQQQEQQGQDQEPNQNQQQQQQPESEDQNQGQNEEQNPDPSDSEDPAASDSESEGENAPNPDQPSDATESPQTPPPAEDGQPQPQPPSRLPSFEDQEDMTADQAAALLEAVENLEQEQRAEMAEEARAQRAIDLQVEKDW